MALGSPHHFPQDLPLQGHRLLGQVLHFQAHPFPRHRLAHPGQFFSAALL